jgi:Mrp family chromosome partitioning ATPase
VSQADPQIPVVELLPAFEEEPGVRVRPRAAAHAAHAALAALDERTRQEGGLRLLATRLRALGRDKRLRRIGVVGCSAGEGATTVALGLSRALAAEPRQRVLYLELDLRHPAADEVLRFAAPAVGVAQFLDGRGDVPVLRHPAVGFWVLSSGGARTGPLERRAERLPRLLAAADRVFDFVIADCSPLLPDPDALFLQDHLDGFVLVVRSRHAPRETVARAARMLPPELVVGFVLNAQRDLLKR